MKRFLLLLLLAAGCDRPAVESSDWPSMGTIARVSFKGDGGNNACRWQGNTWVKVQECFLEVEKRLSIWNPDSEISRYTSLAEVSAEMRPCYEAAFALQKQSGGAFNPFWRGQGKGPDLGGIAKGFAVDLAASRISREEISEASLLIDLGGNLKAVRGVWRVGIRDPSRMSGVVRAIALTNGMACATSGEYERGKHIYDGRTGAAVTNDVASVTVVHPSSAMLADGLSTTLFVLGRERGDAFLKEFHPEATAYWVMTGDK